ncbi:hypothetical protein BS17DRAFT_760829 [Gyrodon lividus]|nr:hypothetical protein BS17DRAFT_760829 [Gyrodon lividus]
MPSRSFTVFQDTPTETPQRHNASDDSTVTLSAKDVAATLLSTLAAIEKENLHPVTGERAGPTSGSEAKKRKTGVLATKQLVAPSSKKQKELKAESKKSRKPLSSGGKPKSSDGRKNSKASRSSRRTSPLPPVDEEQELPHQPTRPPVSQADIDSRCYELTVSPLANVSEAYEATRAESQEPDAHTDREQSVEPDIRDYFSCSLVQKPLAATNETQCNADDSNLQHNDFSTPQRKRIYSAFTFSSPSPTSERFKQSQASLIHRDALASKSE